MINIEYSLAKVRNNQTVDQCTVFKKKETSKTMVGNYQILTFYVFAISCKSKFLTGIK